MFSGRILVNKDGDAVEPEEVLQNKVVGLYFSAGWCSPCRDFTPLLCDFYTELVEEAQPPAPFEVVVIPGRGLDEDAAAVARSLTEFRHEATPNMDVALERRSTTSRPSLSWWL